MTAYQEQHQPDQLPDSDMYQLSMPDYRADGTERGWPDWQPSNQDWQSSGPHWPAGDRDRQPGDRDRQPSDRDWPPGDRDRQPSDRDWPPGNRDRQPSDQGRQRRGPGWESSGSPGPPDVPGWPDDGPLPGGAAAGEPAGRRGDPVPGRHDDEAWAILGYMSAAIFGFGPPLVIYLLKMRSSPFVRAHAVQAVNTAATLFLYLVSVAIVGGLLAFNSVTVALTLGGGAIVLLWLVTIMYLVRATIAASGGSFYRIPAWLCATLLRN